MATRLVRRMLSGALQASRVRADARKYRPPSGLDLGPDLACDVELGEPATPKAHMAEADCPRLKEFVGLLGRVPRHPERLDAQLVDRAERGGIEVTEWRFRGGADYWIPASLARPEAGGGPLPAVLAAHGHGSKQGDGRRKVFSRSSNPNDGYGDDLVRRGFAVLSIDLPGFGDRRPSRFQPGPWRADPERLIASTLLLRGATLPGLCVHDLSRAVDFLVELDGIDPERIGVMGHSMGGTLALYLMMFDARVRAGVCVAGVGTWRSITRRHVVHTLAAYVPGMLTLGDLDELLPLLAPRPLALVWGRTDPNFPMEGVEAIQAAMRASYDASGASERFAGLVHEGGHELSDEARRFAFDFLERWNPPSP